MSVFLRADLPEISSQINRDGLNHELCHLQQKSATLTTLLMSPNWLKMAAYNNDDSSVFVARHDTEEYSPLQDLIYQAPPDKKREELPPIFSYYCYEEKIVNYASPTEHKMSCTEVKPDSGSLSRFVYDVDCKMHKLRNVFAKFKFPNIKVEKKFEDRVQIALLSKLHA